MGRSLNHGIFHSWLSWTKWSFSQTQKLDDPIRWLCPFVGGKPPRVAKDVRLPPVLKVPSAEIEGELLIGCGEPKAFWDFVVPEILRLQFFTADILPRKLTCPLKHSGWNSTFLSYGLFLGDTLVFGGVVVLAKCWGTWKWMVVVDLGHRFISQASFFSLLKLVKAHFEGNQWAVLLNPIFLSVASRLTFSGHGLLLLSLRKDLQARIAQRHFKILCRHELSDDHPVLFLPLCLQFKSWGAKSSGQGRLG